MPRDAARIHPPGDHLTVSEIAYLRALGDAIRTAPTRRDRGQAVDIALTKAKSCRADGVLWREIAVVLGFTATTVRRWLRADDTKPLRPPPAAAPPPAQLESAAPAVPPTLAGQFVHAVSETVSLSQSLSQANFSVAASAGIDAGTGDSGGIAPLPAVLTRRTLVISGDPRPGGNAFGMEAATVRRRLEPAQVDVREVACAELSEIARHLDNYRPAVLHVAAHSSCGGVFLSLDGSALTVAYDMFTTVIGSVQLRPLLIVLNVCESADMARALIAVIGSVIAWPTTVDDDQARVFSGELYNELAAGRSVGAAFRAASYTVKSRWPDTGPPVLEGDRAPCLF